MNGDRKILFHEIDSYSVIRQQKNRMVAEILAFEANRLLNTGADDLAAYLAKKYGLDVPEIHEDRMTIDHHESSRDVSGDPHRVAYHLNRGQQAYVTGTEVSVDLPFSGDPEMFGVRPSRYNINPPRGVVHGNTILFVYWDDSPKTDQIRAALNAWLTQLKEYIQWLKYDFGTFPSALKQEAIQAIEQRKQKLLQSQNSVAALGIPLKRRADCITTYAAPEVKRKLAPKLPAATAGSYKPEPILEEAEYQHILDVLESMVRVMERSPQAFSGIDEESLRTFFLVNLNSHYEGQATGETFNYQGKTDILIRSGDRNIFIAECKFWSGPAALTETIDQLLGYLSWRDSKAAILIFNRNKDFSRVLGAIPGAVQVHPNYQKYAAKQGESRFRYVFRHKDDPAKAIHLTVIAFDVPRP